MTHNEVIQKVATESHSHFTDECQNSQTPEWLDDEGLGISLSQWAKWDGVKLMRVFRSALEDCNYHRYAAKIEAMIKECEEM